MRSTELNVLPESDYYICTPSIQTQSTFLYPTCLGYFEYAPGYDLYRNNYDSFLLMYIVSGQCHIEVNGKTVTAKKNQIVFVDCFKPHRYYSSTGWNALWLHFNGIVARPYFELITEDRILFTLTDTYTFEKCLRRIYHSFHIGKPLKDALISQYITTALTELIIARNESSPSVQKKDIIEETLHYIHEHLCENLTLQDLSSRVSLSPFYFTRLFKRETGFSPHEYLIESRVNAAKFMLKNSSESIKNITFSTGFSSESAFCSTFKKKVGLTPSAYREYMPKTERN